MRRDIKEISSGIRIFENGLLDYNIEHVKFTRPQVKVTIDKEAYGPFLALL